MESQPQPWPSELSSTRQGCGLELKDKYTVRYTQDGRHTNDVGAIQANHPVPAHADIYYYEVLVLDGGLSGKIAVGFADKSFKVTRQPGWEPGSYGYHGDDGKKFIGTGSGEDYGPTFTAGDTVGAGIHLGRQELFFTKNGTKLKVAHKPVRAGLYPTIGLHSKGEMVTVNFGHKPWVFDLEGMIAEEKAAHQAAINRIPVSPGTTHQLVRQYLLHYGYADTLRAFDAAAGLLEQAGAQGQGQGQQGQQQLDMAGNGEAGIDASNANGGGGLAGCGHGVSPEDGGSALSLRCGLRRCLLSGDVDGAVGLLRRHCPAVLADSARYGDVHFQLSCQKYIELVRAGRAEEAVTFAQSTLAQLRGPSASMLETSLRDVIALIAYQHPESSPLAHLLSKQQREAVADTVNSAVLAAVGAGGEGSSGAEGSEGGGGGLEMLRPVLAVPAAAQRRPASKVEQLLQQLVAVQGTLHEANGSLGSVFDLKDML